MSDPMPSLDLVSVFDVVPKANRFNKGKIRLELIPSEFKRELGNVFTKGAAKYADDNWKLSAGTPDHQSFIKDRIGSLERHLLAYQEGELFDSEVVKGAENIITSHLGHIAWNALAVLYYELHNASQP